MSAYPLPGEIFKKSKPPRSMLRSTNPPTSSFVAYNSPFDNSFMREFWRKTEISTGALLDRPGMRWRLKIEIQPTPSQISTQTVAAALTKIEGGEFHDASYDIALTRIYQTDRDQPMTIRRGRTFRQDATAPDYPHDVDRVPVFMHTEELSNEHRPKRGASGTTTQRRTHFIKKGNLPCRKPIAAHRQSPGRLLNEPAPEKWDGGRRRREVEGAKTLDCCGPALKLQQRLRFHRHRDLPELRGALRIH